MDGQHRGSFGLGLLMGVIVGGAIALLYAPRSGKDTRAMIAGKISNVAQIVGETVGSVRHAVGEKVSGEECS
jgi:gas vesicle protein